MRVSLGIYQIPRNGTDPQNSEDAVAHAAIPTRLALEDPVGISRQQAFTQETHFTLEEGVTLRCALADGAGSTFDPGSWAKRLVHTFVTCPPRDSGLHMWTSILGKEWCEELEPGKLPWYAQEKFRRRGSASTLVGLEIGHHPNGQHIGFEWKALALGDSVLLHVRNGCLEKTLPLTNSAEFECSPALLSIDPEYNRRSLRQLHTEKGTCQDGDVFLLASDALGEWLLRSAENSPDWTSLIGNLEENFESRVSSLQNNGKVDRDDASLAVIDIG
jgi:hypothetical protein